MYIYVKKMKWNIMSLSLGKKVTTTSAIKDKPNKKKSKPEQIAAVDEIKTFQG